MTSKFTGSQIQKSFWMSLSKISAHLHPQNYISDICKLNSWNINIMLHLFWWKKIQPYLKHFKNTVVKNSFFISLEWRDYKTRIRLLQLKTRSVPNTMDYPSTPCHNQTKEDGQRKADKRPEETVHLCLNNFQRNWGWNTITIAVFRVRVSHEATNWGQPLVRHAAIKREMALEDCNKFNWVCWITW